MEFKKFRKIPRLSRDIVITEKLDGTNGQIYVPEDLDPSGVCVGSRNRWLSLETDNFGFCKWVHENMEELLQLGSGCHYGEWWGEGIQRGYGLKEKRFSLFNTSLIEVPSCCSLVPVLYVGNFDTNEIDRCLSELEEGGSVAAPGFMSPEGICIYHTASCSYFKKTIVGDDKPKSLL